MSQRPLLTLVSSLSQREMISAGCLPAFQLFLTYLVANVAHLICPKPASFAEGKTGFQNCFAGGRVHVSRNQERGSDRK